MASPDPYLYRDLKTLVSYYSNNASFRQAVQSIIQNQETSRWYIKVSPDSQARPVRVYLWAIELVAPGRYTNLIRKPSPESVDTVFRKFNNDQQSISVLDRWISKQQEAKQLTEAAKPPVQETVPQEPQIVSAQNNKQIYSNTPSASTASKPEEGKTAESTTQLPTVQDRQNQARIDHLTQGGKVTQYSRGITKEEQQIKQQALRMNRTTAGGTIPIMRPSTEVPPPPSDPSGSAVTTPARVPTALTSNISLASRSIGRISESFKGSTLSSPIKGAASASQILAKNIGSRTLRSAIGSLPLGLGSIISGGASGAATVGKGVLAGAGLAGGPLSLGLTLILERKKLINLLKYLALAILAFILLSRDTIQDRVNTLFPPFEHEVTNQLTVNKSGPSTVENRQEISYSITVNYQAGEGPANIEITDRVPENTTFIEASDDATAENEIIKWVLTSIAPGSSKTVTFIVSPNEGGEWHDDIWVVNAAEVKILKVAGGGVIDIKSQSLLDLFSRAAANAGIPAAFLKAIARTESGVLTYTDTEVILFSTIGWWEGKRDNASRLQDNHPDIIRGYGYNTCLYVRCGPGSDVRGGMQFELQTWNGIKGKLNFVDGHDPDRRNVTDNVFGSAVLNKDHAVAIGVNETENWNEDTVRKLARWYCAGSGAVSNPELIKNTACGWHGPLSQTYDDRVWEYYKYYQTSQ